MAIGDEVGKKAIDALNQTTIPEVQAAFAQFVTQISQQIITQAFGAVTQAAGSLETAIGSFPANFVDALDGMTIEMSPVKWTIKRRP